MRNSIAAICAGLIFLQSVAAQYRAAVPGYRFEFPRDLFEHPEFQTEWWYYTGNLQSQDGHHFGFELTFFRRAVDRERTQADPWDIRDLYLAQFAVSDLDGRRYLRAERLNRAGPGIAGAAASRSRIWNGNWQVQWEGADQELQALDSHVQLRLKLHPEKPPIVHGESGVSQKAAGAGHASYYVSLTRLDANGNLDIEGAKLDVSGLAWMDHEFFTHQLDPDQAGWNWICLQLDDNTELMLFRIRRKDGTLDPFSAGTFVDAHGKAAHLQSSNFTMQPLADTWTSPATHATYPVAWKIAVPSLGIELLTQTKLANQELAANGGFVPSYWEGAIYVEGSRGVSKLKGVGYLEMTGYDHPVDLDP
jgi:predicted secreted hydrolase